MGDHSRTSIIIAGIALGACALAGIAYSLGWFPGRARFEIPAPKAPAMAAASAPKAAPDASGIALLPGETLIAPPGPVQAAPPPAQPTTTPQPAAPAPRAPSPPKYNKPTPRPAPAPASAPKAPASYAREDRRPSAYERSTRSVCLNCGVVTGITQDDYQWEIRVRFDDGSRKRLRYYDRPRVDIGDAVRLEEDRLVRE